MIYLTGDTHAEIDIHKFNTKNFPQGNNLTKDDCLIILGDFGLVWDNSKTDLYWRKWLDNKPWTTLFVDGNHENFNLLYEFPIEDKFGGKVAKISDSIYHLKRGEIYTIDNKKFFTFGGAESVDKYNRKENKSWWEQEIPTKEEMQYGVDNLEKDNYEIDYILTHTCPSDIMPFVFNNSKPNGEVERYLNFVKYMLDNNEIDYKWYFGHFHRSLLDIKDRYNCLYKRIIKL